MTQRRLFIATASGMAGAGDLDQAMALRANAQAATTTTTNAASGACCARCGKPKPQATGGTPALFAKTAEQQALARAEERARAAGRSAPLFPRINAHNRPVYAWEKPAETSAPAMPSMVRAIEDAAKGTGR